MFNQESGDMSFTIAGGSDEAFDVICDPCHFEKKIVEANGYCTSCNDNLCDACIKFHRKMSTLRSHVIEKKARPESEKIRGGGGGAASSVDTDPLTDRCEQHLHELVSFYCNEHKALACGACLHLNHKQCKTVSYIRDVSGDFANSDELNNVQIQLNRTMVNLKFRGKKTESAKSAITLHYDKTLGEIDNFEKEMVDFVKTRADDARHEATRLRDEALKESLEQTAACDELVKDADQMTTDVETKIKSGLNNSLFIVAKRIQSKLPDLQKKADHISNTVPKRFVFTREKRVVDLITQKAGLGQLVVSDKPKGANFSHEVDVSCARDTSRCFITGISAVSGGRLVLPDHKNNSVKVADTKQRKIIDQLSTSSPPLCIAAMDDDEVAITLKGEQIIQVFTLAPRLVKSRGIKVRHQYRGIAYKSDKFALTLLGKPFSRIHILDVTGNLLLNIDTTMAIPSYITLSPDQDVMYVSDFERHEVVCFTMSGDVISTYTHKELKKPGGLAVDEDGCLYICSWGNHSLHQILPGTDIAGPILTGRANSDTVGTKYLTYPRAVAYNDNHLYISSNCINSDITKYIKVYTLQ